MVPRPRPLPRPPHHPPPRPPHLQLVAHQPSARHASLASAQACTGGLRRSAELALRSRWAHVPRNVCRIHSGRRLTGSVARMRRCWSERVHVGIFHRYATAPSELAPHRMAPSYRDSIAMLAQKLCTAVGLLSECSHLGRLTTFCLSHAAVMLAQEFRQLPRYRILFESLYSRFPSPLS